MTPAPSPCRCPGPCPCLFPCPFQRRAPPLVLAFALGLALAGGVEPGGAGAGRRLKRRDRREVAARVLALGFLEVRGRAFRVAVKFRAQQRRGTALGERARDRAGQQRRERPDAKRDRQKRKAKARHPVTPCPDRARFPRATCPARAEKCVCDQRVRQISTTPGGPPFWAVRGSRALWLTKLKRIWLTGR